MCNVKVKYTVSYGEPCGNMNRTRQTSEVVDRITNELVLWCKEASREGVWDVLDRIYRHNQRVVGILLHDWENATT
ncbi:hypothetical protein [Bacillus sp. SM2101]|uniref:hypothetical protein n=1 Tax=Bacillus sp. SM2101 TaxID=2805366 RepID=UPI001BDE2F62|nr:hypothetical protein [Bacillus sp. SM2101]